MGQKTHLGTVVLVVLGSACVGADRVVAPDLPVGPGGPGVQAAVQPSPVPPAEPGPLGEFVLPAPPENNVPTATVSTGIVVPAGVPARVTVSGKLTFIPNPAYSACPNTPAPFVPTPNPVGPAGLDNPERFRAYRVGAGLGDATNPPNLAISFRPLEAGAATITGFVQGPGVLWAGRPVVIPGAVGGPTCGPFNPAYFLTGGQTIAAEALEPPVVTPDRRRVPVGDTVTFQLTIPWATNFFVRGGWRWVPETPPGASALIGNCARQVTCRVVVRERGHVEVDDIVAEGGAIVLGARSPVIEVESGAHVTISPDAVTVRPLGTGGATTNFLQVSVVDAGGAPLPNRTVELSLDGVEGTGGHNHGGAMPAGSLSAAVVNTGPSGRAMATYRADVFGGRVEVRGTSTAAREAAESIAVAVRGHVELQEMGNVDTIGVTTTHPDSHWGTQGMVEALRSLADSFFTEYGRELQVNDMSLPLGGKFDLSNAYTRGGKHGGHRVGRSADVRTHGASPLSSAERKFIHDGWISLGGSVRDEIDNSEAPHYHFTL